MATRITQGGASASPASLASIFAAIETLGRRSLAEIATRAIDRLDVIEGDADLEPEPDDTGNGEDEAFVGLPRGFFKHSGPGCTASDSDFCPLDLGEWEENHGERL